MVFNDLLYNIKEKGLAPLVRDLEGLEVKIVYPFNHSYLIINYRTRIVDLINVYLFIINLGSYVT